MTINDMWLMDSGYPRLEAMVQHLVRPRTQGENLNDLNRIDYLSEVIKEAEALRADHVSAAREAGESWSTIAAQMSMTKQAAQQRFGK